MRNKKQVTGNVTKTGQNLCHVTVQPCFVTSAKVIMREIAKTSRGVSSQDVSLAVLNAELDNIQRFMSELEPIYPVIGMTNIVLLLKLADSF